MSIPEQRFEVPPEYAEVYERAYRRAYEEGQVELGRPAPARAAREARRSRVAERPMGSSRRQSAGGARRSPAKVEAPVPTGRRGRRVASRRRRAVVLPVLLASVVVALLLVASFSLGRSSAGTGPAADATVPGGQWLPGSQGAVESEYAGATLPATVLRVRTDCASLPVADSSGRAVGFRVQNLIDDDPGTAWRCQGRAIGQTVTFTLPASTTVVQVGIVPGYARSDPTTGVDEFLRYNRATRVEWRFDDGTVVRQRLGNDPMDRSIRTIAVPPTPTGHVTLKILRVSPGQRNATVISKVQLRVVK